jgi:hypothetical protein
MKNLKDKILVKKEKTEAQRERDDPKSSASCKNAMKQREQENQIQNTRSIIWM